MRESPLNDELSDDPALQPLAAQLASLRPKLPARETQQMLYRCAFTAGQKMASRQIRRWQVAFATLAILLLGMSITLVNQDRFIARPDPAPTKGSKPVASQVSQDLRRPLAAVVAPPLDAWQIQRDSVAMFDGELAKFKQRTPASRAIAVGAMARGIGSVP